MIVLAATSAVLPITAIVPIHSTLLIGSTASRVVVFREFIRWHIAGPFLIGSVIAVAIASRLYVELPEQVIAIAIGTLMLIAIWLPTINWRPRIAHPWGIVGFVHSFLSTLFAVGAKSDYVQPDHHATIRQLFPEASILMIADAGHWLHAEKPAEFFDLVSRFLTGLD